MLFIVWCCILHIVSSSKVDDTRTDLSMEDAVGNEVGLGRVKREDVCEDKWDKCTTFDCTAHSLWHSMENCRLTCGLCSVVPPANECVDSWQDGDCGSYIEHCKEGREYYSWMKENCGKTCGFCDRVLVSPVNECVDSWQDGYCEPYIDHCEKGSKYYTWFAENCRKSCGFCYGGKQHINKK